VGTILAVARLSDIFTEPLTGIISDNTRSRFGRRKLWMGLGIPVLMLGIWRVFAPPVEVTPAYAALWIAVTFAAFNFVDNPYRAWGAELSHSYAGRTRLAGWREGFGIASSMTALAVIAVLQRSGLGDTREMLFVLAAIFLVAMPVLYGLAFLKVPEAPPEVLERPKASLKDGLAALFGNRPFLMLAAGVGVLLAGAMIGASLHLIVMEKVFNARHLFPYILIGENVAGLLALPFWMWLSKRIGKHRALAMGTAGIALLSAPIPLIPHDQPLLYAACIVARGATQSALAMLVTSMLADVVDLDKLRTGRERTALYYGMVGTFSKIGVAAGILIGTTLPAAFGFETSTIQNSERALFALLATYAWIPMVIVGCATPFFWFYPLTEAVQKDLRSKIDALADRSPEAAS
jgi:Na+/melibiose symporter-like transporter